MYVWAWVGGSIVQRQRRITWRTLRTLRHRLSAAAKERKGKERIRWYGVCQRKQMGSQQPKPFRDEMRCRGRSGSSDGDGDGDGCSGGDSRSHSHCIQMR